MTQTYTFGDLLMVAYISFFAGFLGMVALGVWCKWQHQAHERRRTQIRPNIAAQVGTKPPDLEKFRFPLVHAEFLPRPTAEALYRPATDLTMTGVPRAGHHTAFYESVPRTFDGSEGVTLTATQLRCHIGTVSEHVTMFKARLEEELKAMAMEPPNTHMLVRSLRDTVLADWSLDPEQRQALALYWSHLASLQVLPAYRRYHEVSPDTVNRNMNTIRFDAARQLWTQQPLNASAARVMPGDQLGPPGDPGDHVEAVTITLRRLQEVCAEIEAEAREAAGLRYLALPGCEAAAVE